MWKGGGGGGSSSPKRNGYSIAELLVALSILVGVISGVWATVHHVFEEAEARVIIADVQVLQRAVQRYKREHGKYRKWMRLDHLKRYLGRSNSLRHGINFRGEAISIMPRPFATTKHLGVLYYLGGPNGLKICERVLKHFSTETKPGKYGTPRIAPGQAIKGFVSASNDGLYAGCDRYLGLGLTFE